MTAIMRRGAAKALACDAFRDRSMAQSYTVKAAFGTRLPCEARGNPAQTRGTPQGVLRTPPCAPPLPTRRRRPLGTLVRGPSCAPNPPERLPESLVSASPHLSGPLPGILRGPLSGPRTRSAGRWDLLLTTRPPTQGYRASAEPSPVSNVPQRRRHTASCVQRFTCSQYAVFT
jgi:hypothetical protein